LEPRKAAEQTVERLKRAVAGLDVTSRAYEIGRVLSAGDGIARLAGLPGVSAQELVQFPSGVMGIAFNLDEFEVGCILLGDDAEVSAGSTVRRTGTVVQTPVGEGLIGRVVDPLGYPLDGGPDLDGVLTEPIERDSPPILSRASVSRPLATGIKSIDTMIPIGRGQRELIIGDRNTGKTTVAVNAILNQREEEMVCIYVAIGQRASAIARVCDMLRREGGMEYTIVVAADADSPAGMRFIAPYAGCTMGEYFAESGRDTLIVYDDLTKHAQTYREISLLLRRPPGREAFPGDIFYLHSRLLERAGQWDAEHGAGSQTALPIVETQAQNISAYIPTNVISITDGQVYMSPGLFQSGFLPAVDIGLSVSRVGGKTQIQAMRKLAQSMRLTYTQFIELEQFAKFGTVMESHTQAVLDRGSRIREILKQGASDPVPLSEQVLLLLAAQGEAVMTVEVDSMGEFQQRLREAARERLQELLEKISEGGTVEAEDAAAVERVAAQVAGTLSQRPQAVGPRQTGERPPSDAKGVRPSPDENAE